MELVLIVVLTLPPLLYGSFWWADRIAGSMWLEWPENRGKTFTDYRQWRRTNR